MAPLSCTVRTLACVSLLPRQCHSRMHALRTYTHHVTLPTAMTTSVACGACMHGQQQQQQQRRWLSSSLSLCSDDVHADITSHSSDDDDADRMVADVMQHSEKAAVLQLACSGASLFIGGKAGTGKSYLLRALVRVLRRQHHLRVAVTASTGIAALHIGGNTLHSTFGLPPHYDGTEDDDNSAHTHDKDKGYTAAIHRRPRGVVRRGSGSWDAQVLSSIDVLVVDEVSLLPASLLESLDHAARRVRSAQCSSSSSAIGNCTQRKQQQEQSSSSSSCVQLPFGGLQVILAGDFLQLTPIAAATTAVVTRRAEGNTSERLVCRGVVRPRYDANNDDDDDGEGDKDASARSTCVLSPPPDTLQQQEQTQPQAHTRRGAVASYMNKPMYMSYVFHHCLLALQLHKPGRHAEDAHFLRDLDALRRGVLHERIARSAYVNAASEDALCLYATRREVRMHNAHALSQLTGRTCTFASSLHLGGVVPAAAAAASTSTSTTATTTATTSSSAAGVYSRDVALLEWRLLRGSADAHIVSTIRQLCAQSSSSSSSSSRVKIAASDVLVQPMPPSGLHAYSQRVVVRCRGATRRQAQANLAQLVRAADAYVRSGRLPTRHTHTTGAQRTATVAVAAAATTTTAQLLRCYSCTPRQLRRMLQHTLRRTLRQLTHSSEVLLRHTTLKVGCRVMLLRNLSRAYVNGALGTVVDVVPLHTCAALVPRELKVCLPPRHAALVHHALAAAAATTTVTASTATATATATTSDSQDSEAGEQRQQQDHDNSTHRRRRRQQRVCKTAAPLHVDVPLVRMDGSGTVIAVPYILVTPPLSYCHAWQQQQQQQQQQPEAAEQQQQQVCTRSSPPSLSRNRHLARPHRCRLHPSPLRHGPLVCSSGGVSWSVCCMPLTPAYAFTVHKAQGMTFDSPVVFDAANMFVSDHMVYVAASRVRRFAQLRLLNLSPRHVTVHKPSLAFSEQLPDVHTAARVWRTWMQQQQQQRTRQGRRVAAATTTTTTRDLLFLPSWCA